MITKKFTCKTKYVPIIGEFIVNSAENDIDDFRAYSSMFSIDYFAAIRSKIEVCNELIEASALSKELTFVTQQLRDKAKKFRLDVNALDRYLKLGSETLDIAVEDIGLKNVRTDISRGNVEGLVSKMQAALIIVKRNLPALKAIGMKQTFLDEIKTHLHEINALNEKQNMLTSKRNRLTIENIEKFNDLWNSLKLIMSTAKLIYQDVNEAKLKDYTIAQLKTRINDER
jgi:hypothetical protein